MAKNKKKKETFMQGNSVIAQLLRMIFFGQDAGRKDYSKQFNSHGSGSDVRLWVSQKNNPAQLWAGQKPKE